MPCYTVRMTSVEFKAAHKGLLDEAVKFLGWRQHTTGSTVRVTTGNYDVIDIDLARGTATFAENIQDRVNELKRAYSAQAIMACAAANDWSVEFDGMTGGGTFVKAGGF